MAVIMINISNASDCFLYYLINCSKNQGLSKMMVILIVMINDDFNYDNRHMRDEKFPPSTATLLQDKES